MSVVSWLPPSEQRFVVERFARATGADAGILALVEPERDLLYVVSAAGASDELNARTPYASTILAAVEHVWEPEIRSVGGAQGAPADLLLSPVLRPHGPVTMLCGVIRGGVRDPDTLLWIASGYAYLLALCGDDPDGLGKLIASTREDPLTGCHTRAALCDRLDEEIARAERHDRDLACLFIDLDGFKRINDRCGHLVGDDVLAAVGAAMRACMRGADTIGRVGGDEFVVVLPETTMDDAVVLAGRLRSALRLSASTVIAEDISASIGVTSWQPGEQREQLIDRADRALLIAKRQDAGMYVQRLSAAPELPEDDPAPATRLSAGAGRRSRGAREPRALPG